MIRLAGVAIMAMALGACSQFCPAPPAAKVKAVPQSILWPKKQPEVAKAPAVAAPKPAAKPAKVKKPTAKAKPAAKVKLAHPKLAGWCARVPAGTSMWQIEAAATARGKALTPKDRAQAQACLRTK